MVQNPRDGPVGFRDLLSRWQVRLSAVVIFCFNVEFEVIPFILIGFFGFSGNVLRLVAGIWSSVEMSWWVYFTGWISKEVYKIKSVSNVVERSKEVKADALKEIEEFIKEHTIIQFDVDQWQRSKVYINAMYILKGFGYTLGWLLILFISAIPFPGIWLSGLALCRKSDWKFGYAALFIGNFIKNFFFAYIWELIWPYNVYLIFFIVLTVSGVFLYKKYRKMSWTELLLKTLTYFSKNGKNHQ